MSAAGKRGSRKVLVAEAGRDGDLVATLGAAAVQDGCAGLGGHANEESVDLAATAAVGLKGALGHDFSLSCSSSMEDGVCAGGQKKSNAARAGRNMLNEQLPQQVLVYPTARKEATVRAFASWIHFSGSRSQC